MVNKKTMFTGLRFQSLLLVVVIFGILTSFGAKADDNVDMTNLLLGDVDELANDPGIPVEIPAAVQSEVESLPAPLRVAGPEEVDPVTKGESEHPVTIIIDKRGDLEEESGGSLPSPSLPKNLKPKDADLSHAASPPITDDFGGGFGVMPVVVCASCTPEERLQLRIRRARSVAAELNALLKEIEPLIGSESAINIILKDSTSSAAHDLAEAVRLSGVAVADAPVVQIISAPEPSEVRRNDAENVFVMRYAQQAAHGDEARVVLRSGFIERSMVVGDQIENKGRRYTLSAIEKKGGRLVAIVTDSRGRERTLGWQ